MRLPAVLNNGVEAGRLSLVSPLAARRRRAKAELAEVRNWLVASVAPEVFVAYDAPAGKTEQLCRSLAASGKPSLTFASSSGGLRSQASRWIP